MRAKDMKRLLYNAIPQGDSWSCCKHEPYGAFDLNDEKVINRVLYCVTPTTEIFDYAYTHLFDVVISHHPFPVNHRIPQMIFHTPLDFCKGGLNDMWRDYLGMTNYRHVEEKMGWIGEIEPITFSDLTHKVFQKYGKYPLGQVVNRNSGLIKTIGVCTGLGGFVTRQFEKTNVDVYITGELCDHVDDIHIRGIIEMGHTLSEICGVDLFKKLLEPYGIVVDAAPIYMERFGTEVFDRREAYGEPWK